MKNRIIMLCIIAVFAGCTSSNEPQSGEKEKYQGRDETKKLEGASAVGYDGTAVRKGVDSTLNKNDDHNRDLDNANKAGADK